MWESILSSALVIGTICLIYGVVSFINNRKRIKQAQEYFQSLQKALTPEAKVLLLGGILGTIKTVDDTLLVVSLGDGVEIQCMKEAIQRVIE